MINLANGEPSMKRLWPFFFKGFEAFSLFLSALEETRVDDDADVDAVPDVEGAAKLYDESNVDVEADDVDDFKWREA